VRGNGARYRHLEVDRLSWQLQQRRDPRPGFVGTFGVHPRDELSLESWRGNMMNTNCGANQGTSMPTRSCAAR
jgi:hypothetical protein